MRTTTLRRTRDGTLITLGAALMLVVLLVLQLFLGSGMLSTKTETVTSTTTTTDPFEQVAYASANHLMELSARNISAMVQGYESNATFEVTGVSAYHGNFTGHEEIGVMLGSIVSVGGNPSINFTMWNEHQSVGVKGNVFVVNFSFGFLEWTIGQYWSIPQGNNPVPIKSEGTVVAQAVYEHVGGSSWLIAREVWNFTNYYQDIITG